MPTNQVYVTGALYCGFGGFADMPEGKTWADVSAWYVKWDTLHYEIEGVWREAALASEVHDLIDFKRPIEGSVQVHPSDDYDPDYETELATA